MIDDNCYPGMYDFIEQVFHGGSQIAKGGICHAVVKLSTLELFGYIFHNGLLSRKRQFVHKKSLTIE
jgi:hypothetical protein